LHAHAFCNADRDTDSCCDGHIHTYRYAHVHPICDAESVSVAQPDWNSHAQRHTHACRHRDPDAYAGAELYADGHCDAPGIGEAAQFPALCRTDVLVHSTGGPAAVL